MTDKNNRAQWSDPWPSGQPTWSDPPWVLRGRVLTAWFRAPWEALESSLSPELRPPKTDQVRIRCRFYDLSFEAVGLPSSGTVAQRKGRFKEAAVGFPCEHRGLKGDSSLFLWTNSEIYMLWAREVFGFPVRLGTVSLEGSIWTEEDPNGTVGGATVNDSWGSLSIEVQELREDQTTTRPAPPIWFTTRRVINPAGQGDDRREVFLVHPTARKMSKRYLGRGSVSASFPSDHPLSSLGAVQDADFDLFSEIELVIGDHVDSLPVE
jgi:hypothetical protein